MNLKIDIRMWVFSRTDLLKNHIVFINITNESFFTLRASACYNGALSFSIYKYFPYYLCIYVVFIIIFYYCTTDWFLLCIVTYNMVSPQGEIKIDWMKKLAENVFGSFFKCIYLYLYLFEYLKIFSKCVLTAPSIRFQKLVARIYCL